MESVPTELRKAAPLPAALLTPSVKLGAESSGPSVNSLHAVSRTLHKKSWKAGLLRPVESGHFSRLRPSFGVKMLHKVNERNVCDMGIWAQGPSQGSGGGSNVRSGGRIVLAFTTELDQPFFFFFCCSDTDIYNAARVQTANFLFCQRPLRGDLNEILFTR